LIAVSFFLLVRLPSQIHSCCERTSAAQRDGV
jgi:hypothetical protein